MSPLRRITLITIVGCAIVAGWASAASARQVDDPQLLARTGASTVQTQSSSDERNDLTLPIAFAAAVVLVAVGTAGYAHRTRVRHRATA